MTDQAALPATVQASDGQSWHSPAQESSLGLIPVVCLLFVYGEAQVSVSMATSNSEHLAKTNLEGRKEHSTVSAKLTPSLVSD
jgi:hypothetical protein